MAKKQTPTVQDYHKSETYKNADAETRRNLHRYKSELNITDEQMNWLMALEDVRLTPKEQRRKGNATAEMMVIGSTVTFLLAANVGQRAFMLIASVFFIFAAGLYLSGALNPYSIAIRKMKKQLKAYPKVPSFKEWSKPADKDDNEYAIPLLSYTAFLILHKAPAAALRQGLCAVVRPACFYGK